MCALAAGRFLVNLKYITKSHEAGQWLDPEQHTRFLALPDLCLYFRFSVADMSSHRGNRICTHICHIGRY